MGKKQTIFCVSSQEKAGFGVIYKKQEYEERQGTLGGR